jgi:hypothetical protein
MSHVPCRRSRRRVVVLGGLLLVAAIASEARASLIIIPHYNGTVPAAAQTAFNYAINEFETRFTNNMTVNVNVGFGNTGLGQSDSTYVGGFLYSTVRGALAAEAVANPLDTIKQTVVANLPASNPAPTNNFWMTTANAKALGFAVNPLLSDGSILFSNAVTYTYDPNHRGVPGEYDFIGVAEHEISEVLGRDPGLGFNFFNGPAYLPNDLFRFTAPGAVHRSFAQNVPNSPGVYFSVDNGNTNLVNFWSQSIDNDDYRGDNPTDPFNQFAGAGQAHALTFAGIANLDAFGYNRAIAVPEPATLTLFGAGFLAIGGIYVRRKRALVR